MHELNWTEWLLVLTGVLLLWVVSLAYKLKAFKEVLLRCSKNGHAEKIDQHWYYIVDADQYWELRNAGLLTPENIQQYHVDAAIAWLKNMGAGFFSTEENGHHISHMDLVRTVVKAVREAERP